MASGKEIRTKIGSIKNTQKITSAMEMVAASKMRKAQERMETGKPYAERIRAVVGHMAAGNPDYQHVYLEDRPEVKRVGYIIVSTDRGLCGGLNINLFKTVIKHSKEWADQGVEVDLCMVGAKGASFFSGIGGNIVASVRDLGEQPSVNDLIGSVKVMLDGFVEGRLDKLYLVGNEFVNTMTQSPIMVRYIESQIYQAVVENGACEQAARMIAMKSATENAGDLINDLQLAYNKARQASITQELSEIVSGAAAV